MFGNHLKVILRNLNKHKAYSLINILGLSIGLASCLLIIIFIQEELSYDRFHSRAERIYRVGFEVTMGTGSKAIATTPHRLASHLKTDFPELEKVIRFSHPFNREVQYQDKKFREDKIAFVDSAFFEVFNFEMISGDPTKAILGPNSVVITEKIAKKYFGEKEPLGQILNVGQPFGDGDMELKVTGIIREMPSNSHFHMDFLVSMATGKEYFPKSLYRNWGFDSFHTYVVLPEDLSSQTFESRLIDFGEKHIKGTWFIKFFAQPIVGIHLHSNLNNELEANSDDIYIYIFSIVAIIILLIACVNYINLAIARSAMRSKEVGIRKTAGASRQQIVTQFLGESLFVISLAIVIGGLLAEVSLIFFNRILEKDLDINLLSNPPLLLAYISLSYLIGIIAGSYPAFYLSSFNSVKVLKGTAVKLGGGALFLRKGLVAFQFVISIGLIIGTLIVYNQWQFLRNKKLGAKTDNIIMVPATNAIRTNFKTLKTELLRNSKILDVFTANRSMGKDINFGREITTEVDGEKVKARISSIFVNYDFLAAYDVPLLAGRYFSEEFLTDSSAVIFNQSAAKALGIFPQEKAVGKIVEYDNQRIKTHVIGVVEDFHFEVLYNKIKPMAFFPSKSGMGWISIKFIPDDIPGTLALIENKWKEFDQKRAFRYAFLDEDLKNLYKAEERFLTIFTTFSGLAIFTACLGIFGLASFTIRQRAKEISIRKILGSSVGNISAMLTWDFLKLILIANVVACPITYFAMKYWLENFAYRSEIAWWIFLVAAILAVLVACLTVGVRAFNAATVNPVEALKEN